MNIPSGKCPRCGSLWQLKPAFGNFYWSCDCPPARTYTTDNTAALSPAKSSDVENKEGGAS